ncbi:hypothetical protein GCM10023353_36530 [Tomitella cavernea]|uniref:Uncharacterized protein n=1 Tax=Tomitella cavernea TaxID=1387982 RepID=A0ABP9D0F9_9ACTN
MIHLPPTHFGRRVLRTVAAGQVVRIEVRLPAETAQRLYTRAGQTERTLSSITAEAIDALCDSEPEADRSRAGP